MKLQEGGYRKDLYTTGTPLRNKQLFNRVNYLQSKQKTRTFSEQQFPSWIRYYHIEDGKFVESTAWLARTHTSNYETHLDAKYRLSNGKIVARNEAEAPKLIYDVASGNPVIERESLVRLLEERLKIDQKKASSIISALFFDTDILDSSVLLL